MGDTFFRGQGRVFIGLRDASGNPKNLRYVGNVPELKITLESTTLEHKESTSGQSLQDFRMDVGKKASASLVLENFTKENLAIGFRGTVLSVAASTAITAEVLGGGSTTAAVADILVFAKRNASAVVIKDSTGSPKTLTVNVNYKLNALGGHIELLDLTTGGPFVQPLKADYTPGISSELGLFTAGSQEYFLRFEGLNTCDTNAPVVVDIFRMAYDPAKTLDLITDEISKFPLDGSCLADSLKSASGPLGQFGAIYNLK